MKTKQTLLVVEDSEVNRKILVRILEKRGYSTLQAENGQVALDMMQSPQTNISLVLLDLTMPVMNGYELLERMKQTGLLTMIPVIVMTGSEKGAAELRSLECGASDFLTKPYNPEIVCHRVESILRLCDNAALISKLEIDRVTGVLTREAFYRHAEMALDEHPNEKYDIICSNIENFKMINAKYGVSVGDALLRFIANHNVVCAGEGSVCGRLGSDNFVALRPRRGMHTQEEIGKQYAEDFKDAPVKNFVMQYGLYPVTDRSLPISDMCDRAVLALNSIRHKYGMYYAVYDDAMRQKIFREHQLTNLMEQSLADKQFVVYLQPKHDVETGKIAGAEALVRWIHPELGFVSPGEFIPLFERNGFITKLDFYVWEIVCRLLKKWAENGIAAIPISVNASRADFEVPDLAKVILDLVDSHGVPHDMLHLEVTESAYTDNPQQIISVVSLLRAMGFLIEMDDFGSGYSSLNMLSELPIDMLKLDMRFMQNGSGLYPDSKRNILSFIVSLSKWLQLPTIAEGVETADEVDILRSMGCNYIQGYYYAKPMSIADFEQYMRSQREKEAANGGQNARIGDVPVVGAANQKLLKVLIAEDIESNRELVKSILAPFYDVVTATNGEEAYQYIKSHCGELSCMLLDLLMPVMDGFQLLEHMRNDGTLKRLPVIITSEAGTDSELRALRLGAHSFVSKPYNAEILLHHVEAAVHEHAFRALQQ